MWKKFNGFEPLKLTTNKNKNKIKIIEAQSVEEVFERKFP